MDDIFDILKAGLESRSRANEPAPIPEKEQVKRLKNFIDRKVDFKVGDRLVRNEDGENKYRWPTKNQIALVASVFDPPMMDEGGHICHGEIALSLRKPNTEEITVLVFPVDFRYYKSRPYAI
jgi:hypothetical protein